MATERRRAAITAPLHRARPDSKPPMPTPNRLRAVRSSNKGEVEGRAFARLAFRPDIPAMPRDDALRVCKADARSGVLILGDQSLEWQEDTVDVAGVKSDPLVAYEERTNAIRSV